ncbi:putative GerE/LuxR family transcriptional regulator [Hoeflea phototrophica DFL-43]|uniref:Putative GerE/LuxR family transcriptional regulator n=2 Tax=Hoeflea TaxID=274591 RepID=A9CYJ4_HOEPD|nr:putative GerE/LuxR family transcriptional regulator [Hoeflea phototrophica DFL-43]
MMEGDESMDIATVQNRNGLEDRSFHKIFNGGDAMAGSTADLFPKLVAMQRQCAAAGFAVMSAREQTLLAAGNLDITMKSPGCDAMAGPLLKSQMGFLLRHLDSSPRPILYAANSDAVPSPPPALPLMQTEEGRTDLLFPVSLGAMGNGYIGFFGVDGAIDSELLIDLHRKSLAMMRETLRLAFGAAPVADKLNEREIECLQLVGNGMKSEAIGERLNLSVHTVNAYLGSATTKLDAVNRIQAIAKSIRLGIIA